MKIEVPYPLVEVETGPLETGIAVGVPDLPEVAAGLVGGEGSDFETYWGAFGLHVE